MKVKLKKAKGKPGQEALVGDGHGREVISGASDWAILLWITLLSFGCIYFRSSQGDQGGDRKGREGKRRMGRDIYTCEAKAKPEGRKLPPPDEPPPAGIAPSALSSSSPSKEGWGFPK